MEKTKLRRKYKVCRWLQVICLAFSVLSCVVPIAVSAISTAPKMQNTEDKISLGGVATFFAAIVLLIIFRSIVNKFISKLPYTLMALISVGTILVFMICLEKIIDEAIAILVIGLIGVAVGFVFELVSMFFKAIAEETKERYLGINKDV